MAACRAALAFLSHAKDCSPDDIRLDPTSRPRDRKLLNLETHTRSLKPAKPREPRSEHLSHNPETLHLKAKALNLERKAYPQLKPDPVILTPEPDTSNALPTE